MKILVTGCAGFIGYHLCNNLINNKKIKTLIGIDNLNNYYDINLKKDRLKLLSNSKFIFKKIDICNELSLTNLFSKYKFDIVINLAAQAGVRTSITNPEIYYSSNIDGFFNILNLSRKYKVKKFFYASTSSIYGDASKFPIKESFDTNKPLSFYAATKKTNEIMAYSYSEIYKIKTIALRFFTVYGPYGRPDMAIYKFTKNILSNRVLEVYNNGKHSRDFTYIDDVINNVVKLIFKNKKNSKLFEYYNVASGKKIGLMQLIKLLEKKLNKKAKLKYLKKQKGDVFSTHASNNKLIRITNNKVSTNISFGLDKYIKWFKNYEQ